jgi:hypothetical protein
MHWHLDFVFLHQLILDTPQLAQFLSRIPKLKTWKEAHVVLLHDIVQVRLYLPFSAVPRFFLRTTCKALDQQLSFLAQVCRSPSLIGTPLHPRSVQGLTPARPDDFENNQWLGILRSFAAAKNLFLSKEIVPRIAPAFKLVGEGLTTALPSLQSLSWRSPTHRDPSKMLLGNLSRHDNFPIAL